jgi:hypothetical protein
MGPEERLEKIELTLETLSKEVSEMHTVLMGPAPGRDNGVRGGLRELSDEAHIAIKLLDEFRFKEGHAIAALSLKGVYAIGILQFAGMIIVALIMKGII